MNGHPIDSFVEALGWMLLHFVWQGTAIAVALWCLLRLAQNTSAQFRYGTACAALLLMLTTGLVTFVKVFDNQMAPAQQLTSAAVLDGDRVPSQVTNSIPIAPPAHRETTSQIARPISKSSVSSLSSIAVRLRPWLSWIVGLWAIGVAFHSLRLFVGWRGICCLRASGRELDDAVWIERFDRLRNRLGVSRGVRLLASATATVPMVIGCLKPVVLVPTGLLTGLNSAQVEAILMHELSHIRRHDYLVNLLQNVVETQFFFHPALWWISAQVRQERENCCDDVASAYCGNSVEYARALTALEEFRSAPAASTVAASGGSLLDRVRRLTSVRHPAPNHTLSPVQVLAVMVLLGVGLPMAMSWALETPIKTTEKNLEGSTDKPTPEVVPEPGSESIRINVFNASGDRPIPTFHVIAGVPSGAGTSREFETRTGREAVNWQPHTIRNGTDGIAIWPLKKAYAVMDLRVEADGYLPQTTGWLEKSAGGQNIIVTMRRDPGIEGRVMSPNGEIAAGATIALAMPQRDATIVSGQIRGADHPLPTKESDRWRQPTIVKTDAEGRFRIRTETDPASAVLVVHDSGVREMTNDEFKASSNITLQPWGRIEGRVLWHDKPATNELVTLTISRDSYGYPGTIGSFASTQTDSGGRFIFEKVLPGRAQISRPIPVSQENESGIQEAIFPGLYDHVQVAAGTPTAVLIGGQGRTVTGRLIGRDSWEGVTFHFHPNAPHIGFPGDNALWAAFGRFRNSEIGPLFFRDGLVPNADGSFELPNMLPGRYQFFVSSPDLKKYAGSTVLQVPAETPGKVPSPIDLGEITVR